jgi:hypothetical protein
MHVHEHKKNHKHTRVYLCGECCVLRRDAVFSLCYVTSYPRRQKFVFHSHRRENLKSHIRPYHPYKEFPIIFSKQRSRYEGIEVNLLNRQLEERRLSFKTVQSLSWSRNVLLLYNSKIHYLIHKSPTVDPTLNRSNLCKSDRITVTTTNTSRSIFIINLASLLHVSISQGPSSGSYMNTNCHWITNVDPYSWT